jgi:sterol desaturase/sphingolipid hydroxylase (fatty acid hydroxylase superfamily)
MRANAVYVLLYTSGLYGLVLWPPVHGAVTVAAEPLRIALAPAVAHLPLVVRCALALIVFDALAYWVHRAAHASPLLWRVHRVHHSDPDFGPMTTFRFHVLEIAWRMAIQFLPLYLLGIAAGLPRSVYVALLLFNVLAHSDLGWTFGRLGGTVVSPAYHAVHHRSENASNFGMYLAVWDAWFGTRQRHASAQLIAKS